MVKIPTRKASFYYSIVPLSASLHIKLNALLFRRMRVASRLAANSRLRLYILADEICRDVSWHFFLFFYVGVHVLCIRCPGKPQCLRAWPSSRHSRVPPTRIFFLFYLFLPLTQASLSRGYLRVETLVCHAASCN